MAYDNPGPGAGKAAKRPAEPNTFFLDPDMFPPGMAETLKAGEVIEFKIVAPLDKVHGVEIEYNYGDEGSPAEEAGETPAEEGQEKMGMASDMHESEGGEDWEAEARRTLSPQNSETEAY